MLAWGTYNVQSVGIPLKVFSIETVGGVSLSEVNTLILLQLENAKLPISVTELGIVTDVSPLQNKNAARPIEVTELGIVTDVSPLQLLNASSPIEVTELGIVTDVSPLQSPNAASPIEVTQQHHYVVLSLLFCKKNYYILNIPYYIAKEILY